MSAHMHMHMFIVECYRTLVHVLPEGSPVFMCRVSVPKCLIPTLVALCVGASQARTVQ